jgi:8-oxo-dGTP pyrophosphatase MutT (NUDIX family)
VQAPTKMTAASSSLAAMHPGRPACEDPPVPEADDNAEVRAAGGVVWRRDARGELRVAIAHRPRYDDWSFPKGKLDPGETSEQAALREVEEEIGLRCTLGEELPTARYDVAKGRKVVRYWLMEPRSGGFAPNEEVDEMRWLTPREALELLSYEHDRALAREVPA